MRITQGTFSYLPDFTDDEIAAQIGYALANGWAVAVEVTDDPHPRNVLWDMWGLPMFARAGGGGAGKRGPGAGRPGCPGGPELTGGGAADLRAAGRARPGVGRAGAGQGPGPRDRRATAGRPAEARLRPRVVAAEPAYVLYGKPRNRESHAGRPRG